MAEQRITLTPEQIRAIEDTVSKGTRIEVIPVRDGVKLVRQRREEVKPIKLW